MQVPLFPLNVVLFPGGPLPLRIFEPRYVGMVRDCVRDDAPFGVLLIREGQETGPASTHDIGTLARITDWYQGSDGLLGVTALGLQRFRVISSHTDESGLNIGEIEVLDWKNEGTARYIGVTVANELLYEPLERHMQDASWVSSRFVEILPLDLEEKQRCLESNDPIERLRIVQGLLTAAQVAGSDF